jgi:hypothetical protein
VLSQNGNKKTKSAPALKFYIGLWGSVLLQRAEQKSARSAAAFGMIELLQMGNATFNGHIKANETTAASRFFHLIFFFVCKVGRYYHWGDATPFQQCWDFFHAIIGLRFSSERIGVNCALLNNGPKAGFGY